MSKIRTLPVVRNGRFYNPPGAPQPSCGPSGFAAFVWRRLWDNGQREVPPGHALPLDEVRAGIQAHWHENALTWLGHAAFLIRLGGKTLLTDPFLSDVAAPWPARRPRRFCPPALRAEQLPDIDLLLVSHNHYDHLDTPTIKKLRKRADIPVVVPLGLGAFFKRRGYTQVSELNWWQSCTVQGLTITAVPAIHFSRRGPTDANKSLWCGFVVEDESGYRVYFAGDTAYHPVFAQIGEEFGVIDYALVPIGAYEPGAIMAGAHVTPEEAVAIAHDVNARNVLPMHWGSIVLTEERVREPAERFFSAMNNYPANPEALLVPEIGKTISLTDFGNRFRVEK